MKRILIVSFLLLFGRITALADTLSPNDLKRIGFDQHIGQRISPDLSFRDADGKLVSLGDFIGKKPTLLVLGYYHCPMLCTLINDGLIQSLQELRFDVGKEFDVVNVSIDPRENSATAAAKKKEYLKRYGRPGAANGWHFLTGDKGAIAQFANETGFRFAFDPAVNEYAHPSGFIVLTPGGKISRYFFGVNFDPRELRNAIIAAGKEERGSIVTQLVLLCYHYNPLTGKYGALIMNVMRGAGIATVIGLGAAIFFLLTRDRRSHARVTSLQRLEDSAVARYRKP